MNKFTKITATIGPASDSLETIEKLILAGVDVFRFNFKHNTLDWHEERIKRVNEVAKKLGVSVGTLIDLQGPEIRLKTAGEQIEIERGDELLLSEEALIGHEQKAISISHPSIIKHLEDNQLILADDGRFAFTLREISGRKYLVSQSKGALKNNKSLNIPGAQFPFPVLIEKDFEGLRLAAKGEIDFVALSFVRSAADIETLRQEMDILKIKAKIIAKIETKMAIDNLGPIIRATDGVMVARGDLGVEIPMEQVPYYQKLIIKKCVERGIPVITATQMIESMILNPFPTRAEVSDVANSVYDFTDAVMLSAESATGLFPEKTVQIMARTLGFNESKLIDDMRKNFMYKQNDQESRIADTAYNLYLQSMHSNEMVSGFVILTQTGRTARLVARYRPRVPIYAFCPSKEVADTLTLCYGVVPLVQEQIYSKKLEVTSDHVREVTKFLKKNEMVTEGANVIVLHGERWTLEGKTSTVKLIEV
jgi:pyruvate kinase